MSSRSGGWLPSSVRFATTLLRLSPSPRDQSPGGPADAWTYNETYFEHSYLARYLGFTLVQGGDLTVRDQPRLPEDARRFEAGGRDPAARGR